MTACPWFKVRIDLFTVKKVDFLIIVDYYSDFWEVDMVENPTTASVIACSKQQFSKHDIPNRVVRS